MTSDSSLDGFDTDVEIKVEINENEIDTSDAMTNEEAAYLVDSDNWFWLFARGEGEGFSAKGAFTENGTEYGFTGTIEFDGYYSNGAIIESGTIAYVSNPDFSLERNLLMGDLVYTAEISEEAPLVIYLPEKNERFVISGNGITGKLWLYVDDSLSEILGMYIRTKKLNGVLTINGQENIERIEKPTATIEDLGIRGAGTKNNPYKIGTETQLRGLAEMVNTGKFNTENVYFLLTSDIDLENRSWIPIGGWDKSKFIDYQEDFDSKIYNIFKGHFDGGNNTISNLSCDIGCTDYNTVLGYNNFAGLFGIVGAGAEIKNLTIDNADVIVAGFAGGFVGFVPNTDTGKAVVLENLHLTGDINIEGNSNLGGILGNLQETVDLEMRDCTVEGNPGSRIGLFIEDSGFSSASFIGGLAGAVHTQIDNGALIKDCSVSDVEISANVGLVGGLFGHFKRGTISGSLSDVSVTISQDCNTKEYPDVTQSLGAIAGTVSNLSRDSYKVILKDISIDDVTLNYPVKTVINLKGLIGRYRENNQPHINFAEIIEGEETISTEGLTINNPGV